MFLISIELIFNFPFCNIQLPATAHSSYQLRLLILIVLYNKLDIDVDILSFKTFPDVIIYSTLPFQISSRDHEAHENVVLLSGYSNI